VVSEGQSGTGGSVKLLAAAQGIAVAFVLIVPWLLLLWHLSTFWLVDAQYSYGWVTPAIAVFFGWRQWKSFRPGNGGNRWMLAGAIGCILLVGLIWFVHDAVPDWSVINWLFGIAVAGYVFLLFAYFWGRGAPSHFAFPILFVLLAIPWPQRIELVLVQALMKFVAATAAQVLAWFNIPAMATGNIIQIPTGTVGIDEACSGVRSLQAMLMTSVFLGELRQLKAVERMILILFGSFLAVLFNLVRTILLTWLSATAGLDAFNRWHDPAGLSILCASFLCLWIASQIFRSEPPNLERGKGLGAWPALPRGVSFGLVLWIVSFLSVTELWYRSHETRDPRYLTVDWPSWALDLNNLPVSDGARQILLCDTAKCACWKDASGLFWTTYFIVWNSERTSTQSARIHRPENCLQGSGAALRAELDPTELILGDARLRFRSYRFERYGLPLFVYYLVWEEGNRDINEVGVSQDWSGSSRLERVWLGQRNIGQQSVEIILAGTNDEREARTALQTKLGSFVRINPSRVDSR
jgi:exosortase